MTVPKMAEPVQMMTNHRTDRPAIRPPRAASAPLAMPVTSKATMSGMTVILSALSHSPPTMLAAFSAGSRIPSPNDAVAMPTPRPATRASRTGQVPEARTGSAAAALPASLKLVS